MAKEKEKAAEVEMTPAKEIERKTVSVSESQDLQKQGWKVVAIKKTGMTKVHILEKV